MCNKFGCSFGMWAVGVGLTATGFVESAVVQSAGAISGIRSVYGAVSYTHLDCSVLYE